MRAKSVYLHAKALRMMFREKKIAALFNETTLTKVGVMTFNCGHARGGHNPGGGGESASD